MKHYSVVAEVTAVSLLPETVCSPFANYESATPVVRIWLTTSPQPPLPTEQFLAGALHR